MRRMALYVLVVCAALGGPAALSAETSDLWIRAGRIFDGEKFLERVTVVVREEKIAEVRDGWEEAPQGALPLDASAMTVTPGFVESHSHFLGSPMPIAQHPERYAGKIAEQGFSKAPDNRLSLFECGITTVIDMGSPLETYQGVQREIEKGSLLCPELRYPGPLITAPAGHPAGTIYTGSHWLIDKGTIQTSDEKEAVRKVDELHSAGVSFIKIVYDGRGGIPRLDLSVAKAIVAEAHQVGLPVYAHVTSPEEAKDMLEAEVDGIEHDFKDMPSLAREMAAKNVIFTPTIQAFRTFLPSAVPGLVQNVRAAYEAGVQVAVGTDFPNGPGQRCGDDYFDELAFLEQSGASRPDVLRSATVVGALKAGETDSIGRIQPGYRANLVFFEGNLEEGAITRDRILKVMFHGAMVVEAGAVAASRRHLFTSRSLIAAPYGYYDPLNSVVIGMNLTDLDLLNTGIQAGLTATASLDARVSASLTAAIPSPLSRTFLNSAVSFDNSRRMGYDRGNDSPVSSAAVYDSTCMEESLRARAQILGPLALNPSVAFRQVWGSTIDEWNDPNETLLGLSASMDTRDCAANPWNGVYAALGGELSTRYLGSTRDFQRVAFDARVFVSPLTHLTLAGRLLARQSFGDTPRWFLPSFGGAEVGRGFLPGRFADNLLLASQLELRFPIAWILRGVAFADFGEVGKELADMSLAGIHSSFGLGLRILPSPDESTVLSLDAGFTREGWALSFKYGHAF